MIMIKLVKNWAKIPALLQFRIHFFSSFISILSKGILAQFFTNFNHNHILHFPPEFGSHPTSGSLRSWPPHSVLFRVRICSYPLFESTPYLRTANISEPPFRGLFAGFSCLGDPPKSGKMLNVPP